MQIKSILMLLAAASTAVDALTIPGGTALETRDFPRPGAGLSARSPNPQPQNNGGKNKGKGGGNNKGKGNGGGNKGNGNGNGNGNGKDCAAAKKLQAGIEKNIEAQKGELASANEIREIVGKNKVDAGEFQKAKEVLLGHVNDGIKLREENQKIAPKGNAAIAGLAKVAEAQKTELEQAKGLQGNSQDLATLTKLKKEFEDGIKVNEQNAKDAVKGCQ
ncbi:hypothetical protein PpBr36_07829 [Pyricularia pennisetigena]|uniref:hypothetical protein n=1 Tax=Pyricularia pennisetigena TaxID=1578925 RepID=UPI00114EC5AD|nr:hypothetical protein PpBr36_07829 [Pyricularia pennisetigena]TLS26061.1 hypothetical protein PpBr36_07829 [Pyricularia pennisetigena]